MDNKPTDKGEWVRGAKRLPSLFKKVKWRNADGGNIPLGEATPLEHYQRTGANIQWHEWLDESPSTEVGQQGVEVIDGYIQIAIDRKTLPKDGQRIKFRTDKEDWYEGYFVDGEDLFFVNESTWFAKWYVHQWKYI